MKNQNKNIYRALLILSFIGLNLLLVAAISNILSYLNTGADKSTMLNLALGAEPVYKPHLVWKDSINPSRPIEKPTKKRVAQDYLNAWYVREVALATGENTGITDYYTESARAKIDTRVLQNKKGKPFIKGASLNHELYLEFYSADGQLISFRDEAVFEIKQIYDQEKLVLETRDTSAYRVVMLLEDGFWRIRHQERIIPQAKDSSAQKSSLKRLPQWIKGVNYYPQEHPWNTFDTLFKAERIQADFEKIKQLNLNTLRIFVGYEDFGKAEVNPEKLNRLKQLMDLAQDAELQVIVTLFDFYGDYSVLDTPNTFKHARSIISALKAHPALLAWDLKNEPDLDFDNRGKDQVTFWLQNHIAHLKQLDPETPVTIGWSKAKAATILEEKLDVVSFHYYEELEDFEETYRDLKANTSKPIMLQEFGLSTYSGLWKPFGNDENDQTTYYERILPILKSNNLHFAFWTLYDFEEVPTAVVGRLPWRRAPQKKFGILDSQGESKEAATLFKALK